MKYIHVLMMCLALTLSTSVQAQKQKKEKEPKEEKVQKEKKQKESKQKESKKKDRFVSFADVKVAKKGTVEYNAQRQAAVLVMDSMLLHARTSEESRKYFGRVFQQDDLEKFADMICAKFGNDPVLMDSVAGAFFGLYSNAFLGEKRFAELKQMHPTFVDVYYTEASYNHTLAWNDYAVLKQIDSTRLVRSKALIDSAKLLIPQSPEPYMRWIRMQGKNDPESVFPEIEALKATAPNYPAYLKVAQDFYRRGLDDPEFLVSARKCYSKAERDSMKLTDYLLYTDLCYKQGMKRFLKEDFLECIEVADEGLSKFPDNLTLLRMKLYSSCELPSNPTVRVNGERIVNYTAEELPERWNYAYEVAKTFTALPDSVKKNATDYSYLADINMNTKHYSAAVKFLKSQLDAGIKDSINHARALRNLLQCYTAMELYDQAEKAFDDFKDYKESVGMSMTFDDYGRLLNVYNAIGKDTFALAEERIAAYEKYNAILPVMKELSPEKELDIYRYSLNTQKAICDIKNVYSVDYLNAATRLAHFITQKPASERDQLDWSYLMLAGYHECAYYVQNDKHGEAWACAEYLKNSMPSSDKISDMSSNNKQAYDAMQTQYFNVLNKYPQYSTPGKKLKRSGWRPF